MNPSTRREISLALRDLGDGMRMWRTWYVLGVSEVRQRYRRSVLGPFWVMLSMGIQALTMGFLLAFLFKIDVQRYLPFLCISLVTWTFFMNTVIEGANCFIAMSTAILQVKRPFWMYIMLVLWRNAIVYLHTVVIFIAAAIGYGIWPSAQYLYIPAGLAILAINAGWMALAAALLSARFRDVPLLIQNAFTVLVWLTPVYYHVDQLGPGVRLITQLNPLTHILEVARGPFLNQVPPMTVWITAFCVALFGWAFTFALFVRARARVTFWL